MTDKMFCKHENGVDMSYGFGRSSGWKGIGVCWHCVDCYTVLEFDDDTEYMSPDEIEHNRIKRETLPTLKKVC